MPSLDVTPEEQAAFDAERAREQQSAAPQPKQLAPHVVEQDGFASRARQFIAAQVGPRVTPEEYRERYATCRRCEHLSVVRIGYRDKIYCGACGCWRWWFARLDRALRRRLFVCKHGKHSRKCAGCGG